MDQRIESFLEIKINNVNKLFNKFFIFNCNLPVLKTIKKVGASRFSSQEAMLVI